MNPVDLGAGKSHLASQYLHFLLTLIDVGVGPKGFTFLKGL
jgi:hypothetical protein